MPEVPMFGLLEPVGGVENRAISPGSGAVPPAQAEPVKKSVLKAPTQVCVAAETRPNPKTTVTARRKIPTRLAPQENRPAIRRCMECRLDFGMKNAKGPEQTLKNKRIVMEILS